MQLILSLLIITFVATGEMSVAFAKWKEEVKLGGPTGQKTVVMTNAALNSASQFGRKVSATLVIRCRESADRVARPHAAIVFSERVAMDAVRTKYRIDNDPVRRNKIASLQDDGFALGLGWTEFMNRLPSSSILQIEFDLPWAGHAWIGFDTTGATEAFRQIRCTSR